ncbi:MAG: hypothetical protein BGO99_13125 [Nitrosospira sp. 56-18]|jgi:hypothetical protein|nr:MAG: hypothetical protein BGO99_13125 [Nitrosospira sp. 56-18]
MARRLASWKVSKEFRVRMECQENWGQALFHYTRPIKTEEKTMKAFRTIVSAAFITQVMQNQHDPAKPGGKEVCSNSFPI